MAYFCDQLRAVASYLASSDLYMWAISGIRGSSGFGLVMGVSSQRLEAGFNPEVTEAVALFRGIAFAEEASLVPAVIESDALYVVIKLGELEWQYFGYCREFITIIHSL
ncbi:hypothetical protein LWI28_006411 [Acer negundo]|uniref:Uncharacterized protein n=1 Tax=Acer negundo TaxID=4023 RepID=A0AAD5NMX0_ACENE|nr:hypothetical protein LWI28_006411 [Acer negundo]